MNEKLLNLGAYIKETAAKLLFLMRSLLKVHKMNNWWKCHEWLPPGLHLVFQKTFYEICCLKCPPKSGSLHETYRELCFPEVAHCAILVWHMKYSLKILKSHCRQWIFNKIDWKIFSVCCVNNFVAIDGVCSLTLQTCLNNRVVFDFQSVMWEGSFWHSVINY